MHDVRYEEVNDEVVLPGRAGSILIFRGGAHGQEAPVRVLQGPNVQAGGSRLAIDSVHRWLRPLFPALGTHFTLLAVKMSTGDIPSKKR